MTKGGWSQKAFGDEKKQLNSRVNRLRLRLYRFIPAINIDLVDHTQCNVKGVCSLLDRLYFIQDLVIFKWSVFLLGCKGVEGLQLSFTKNLILKWTNGEWAIELEVKSGL